jgi:hypothetical protein
VSRRDAVEHLVREELGCTCPAEVFERIEEGQLTLPGLAKPAWRMAIGGRLLVYLIEAGDPAQVVSSLPAWVSAGRAERDAAAMNRLRLVLIADWPETSTPALEAAFGALPDRDGRIHLHVLSPAAVGGICAERRAATAASPGGGPDRPSAVP